MQEVGGVRLQTRAGHTRPLRELTTLFDLCLVVVDGLRPAQLRALAPVIERIDRALSGSDCTVGVLVVGADGAGAVEAVGPLAGRLAVFGDPEGTAAGGLGLASGPALVWVDTQPTVRGAVSGWDGEAWRPLLAGLSRKLAWSRPAMPAPGDPAPLAGRPFAVTAPARPASMERAATSRKEEDKEDKEEDDARLAA